MKQNLLQSNFLYRSWDGFPNVMRYRFRMDRPVDGQALRSAVRESAARYPYFCIRVERYEEKYRFFHNDADLPVLQGEGPLCLGSKETNGYYFATAYQDDTILFYMYHNLCDSRGFIPWVKTVLYLYLVNTADPALGREGVNLPGDPFLPNETEDPYAALEIPKDLEPFFTLEPMPVFVPDTRYAERPGRRDYYAQADSREFMSLSRTKDGSPVVLATWFLKETVKRLFPERNGLPIAAAIPHSMREGLLGENNYHDQLTPLMLRYDERMEKMSMDRQLTASRGSLFLQASWENMLCRIRGSIAFAEELEHLPTVEDRRAASRGAVSQFIQNPETMCVTYPGNTQWGDMSRYIREMYMHTTVLSAPLMVVLHPMNDSFYFTFHQRDDTPAYVNAFVDLLREHGITAETRGDHAPENCRVYIP